MKDDEKFDKYHSECDGLLDQVTKFILNANICIKLSRNKVIAKEKELRDVEIAERLRLEEKADA